MSPTPFKDSFLGPNSFEDLRRYIKKGEDVCKELTTIFQERAELEATYAKGLGKLACKINKVSREMGGTCNISLKITAQVWQSVANAMEGEAETHRNVATAVLEEVVKPLRSLVDNHHKSRKTIESEVEKTSKILSDRRNEEYKSKKLSFICAQENEKVQDMLVDARLGRGKPVAEKDIMKLEGKCRKTEKALNKADQEYYSACLKAEVCRQECETFVSQGSTDLQHLEKDRLVKLKDVVEMYTSIFAKAGPLLAQLYENMQGKVSNMDIQGDLQEIGQICQSEGGVSKQLLPNFCAEDLFNAMKKERRKESLEKILHMVKNDLEQKHQASKGSKNGTKLTFNISSSVLNEVDGTQASSTELYLEATLFKLQCALADLEGINRPTHHLNPYVEQFKDKQGMVQTVLKLPTLVTKPTTTTVTASKTSTVTSTWTDFTKNNDLLLDNVAEYDGKPSIYFDNNLPADPFSIDHVYSTIPARQPQQNKIGIPGQCRAIYNYEANLSDELTLQSGDIITIYDKSNSSWWKGELNGVIGLFPATYVEEIS